VFSIFNVPPESAEFSEQMGTKFKFWYYDENRGLTLFKEGRPRTGENWAEKVSSELAQLLGLPHASYELAEWRGRQGVLSPSFVPVGARLIHGNELVLGKITIAGEDENLRFYQQRSHTASRVFQFLNLSVDAVRPPQGFLPFNGVHTALGVFIGYLLFDVWIANQDRHSENWGVIRIAEDVYLAPTYDHGSSLGRQESDERRVMMMTTRDSGASITSYVKKARSAMYPNVPGNARAKAYFNLELFELAAKMDCVAAQAWLDRLRAVPEDAVRAILDQVPAEHISDVGRDFTAQLLSLNQTRLLAVKI
jgi:hypothetical protein